MPKQTVFRFIIKNFNLTPGTDVGTTMLNFETLKTNTSNLGQCFPYWTIHTGHTILRNNKESSTQKNSGKLQLKVLESPLQETKLCDCNNANDCLTKIINGNCNNPFFKVLNLNILSKNL